MGRYLIAVFVVATTTTLLGCSSTLNKYDYEEPITFERPEEDLAPEPTIPSFDEYTEQSREPEYPHWTCSYDETYNYDWHDDVVCSNGYESHRPYLLEWADFVTYEDIMSAAAEYEASLNGY